jgi:radical SAM superfamily enzyme YgiQ (UPF0313 family)
MATIVLSTLNARYIHAALGLRYLQANLGALQAHSEILEFIITQRPADIAEQILEREPRIVGFGIYIWNVEQTAKVIGILKAVRPEIRIVLGGPEVSYETESQSITGLADHVIQGPGDLVFANLCLELLQQQVPLAPRIIPAPSVAVNTLVLPYALYSDTDIAQRLLYVEASRGCPYKCEFCLSALDKTAWPFDTDRFLAEMGRLYERGARHFKFVDRTFNLNIKVSLRILDFFLARIDERLFLHFELIPDHLPSALRERIAQFPAGSLQFEIGIQTFNPEVQALISRRQDNAEAETNMRWLRQNSQAHIHADLIAGLPGEVLDSFGAGFDRLIGLDPHEIQVGILKRLRGSPIIRHTEDHGLRYNPLPPYDCLSTATLDFMSMRRVNRFARYWDLIGNSGRFLQTRGLLLGATPFARFMRFSDWLYAHTGQTHEFSMDRLFALLYQGLITELREDAVAVREALATDFLRSGHRNIPEFLKASIDPGVLREHRRNAVQGTQRQERHIRSSEL